MQLIFVYYVLDHDHSFSGLTLLVKCQEVHYEPKKQDIRLLSVTLTSANHFKIFFTG